MPESRDRLPRREDGAVLITHPFQRAMGVAAARVGGVGRGPFRTPRGRAAAVSPAIGRENTPVVRNGRRVQLGRRASNSVLPIWYPRTPLQDITGVVRAIERRGIRLREGIEGLEIGSPIVVLQDHALHTPGTLRSGAQLEHEFSQTPRPTTIGRRRKSWHCQCPSSTVGKVPKILLDITNQKSTGESEEFLTPQKKLLNSIDTVEKVVMEELRKLKRTPTAKKAEREKRVRNLMSMR